MSLAPLDGRRVVVSGSTRGLGHAFAVELARQGAAVVVNGRDADRCEEVVAAIAAEGGRAIGVPGSVAEVEVADAMIAACVDAFGGVDLVVNNAGVTRDRTLAKMTEEEWDTVIAIHLRGTWALSRAAVRAMRGAGGGAILNVVSGSALFGLIGQSNYAAAKGGTIALTRALSVELARDRISVNALYPAAATDMTAPVIARAGADAMPFLPPEELAPLVTFLASDAGGELTGQLLHFDGRELTVWSHPEPKATQVLEATWTAADIAAFFAQEPSPAEPLHPDRWGAPLGPGARAARS